MNRFEVYTVATVAALAECVALALFLASFAIWVGVLSGGL